MNIYGQILLNLILFSILCSQIYLILKEYFYPHEISSSKHHEDLDKLGFPAIIRVCTEYEFHKSGYKNNDHYFMCRFLAHHNNSSENISNRGKLGSFLLFTPCMRIFTLDIPFFCLGPFRDIIELNSEEVFEEISITDRNNSREHLNLSELKFRYFYLYLKLMH